MLYCVSPLCLPIPPIGDINFISIGSLSFAANKPPLMMSLLKRGTSKEDILQNIPHPSSLKTYSSMKFLFAKPLTGTLNPQMEYLDSGITHAFQRYN